MAAGDRLVREAAASLPVAQVGDTVGVVGGGQRQLDASGIRPADLTVLVLDMPRLQRRVRVTDPHVDPERCGDELPIRPIPIPDRRSPSVASVRRMRSRPSHKPATTASAS